ncbi:Sushi, nidogen and EGF-like domain-containing protein 1 [Orchesella cincta]|uniref:Sushi, nidogen and EGF-like domain-containing protein 1 n=1 Tax=Orchesella cincta TaxID=48709 RepID=A0A1D2N445_ORCCI|nr:Sushi, nidogen and EGF-like domain-containing protein 1 [Orchesella cincta]
MIDGATLPEDYLPKIQMLEIVSSPLNRSVSVNLWKSRNSDVVIGEDTSATSRILMKCNATYPVQWVYLGDGRPEFTTFTNVKWQENSMVPMSFEAEASLGLLGFHGVLREEDTGNYTCRSIQEPSVHSYYYIYVPGDGLFASPNGTNITYAPQDQYIRIPCGVSHPKASVSLCKKDKDDKLTCPVTGSSGFNSKGGFLLNLKKLRNPSGTYVCTANFKRTARIAEYHVMREDEKPKPVSPMDPPPTFVPKPGKNLCDPSPCGKAAECSVSDGRAVCYCFRGLNGNPYDECAPGRCRSTKDCPRGKFCRQGECTSDPCNPSPCGNGGECSIVRGHSKCSCQRGYTGLPPNCVKSCNENYDCSDDEACIKNICQSPCPGPCGQNAECRVLSDGPKRTAQCSCPSGYIGDPLKTCNVLDANGPPGYVGQPPDCTRKDCDSDEDCPFGRKCIQNVCDKGQPKSCDSKCGLNAQCIMSPTTSDPICVCPPGTTGNPVIRCTSQSTSPSWGDPCSPNPCQSPAQCQIIRGSRVCVCPDGYIGDPINCVLATPSAYPRTSSTSSGNVGGGCRYDAECRQTENCIDGRCQQDPCNGMCGYNAVCEAAYQRRYRSISSGKLLRSQESVCTCPPGHEGNPYVSCMPIRTGPPPSSDFPQSTSAADPVCFPSPCGQFAECSVVNNSPMCTCQPGFEGNPYQECRYPTIPTPSKKSPPPSSSSSALPKTTSFSYPSELDYQGHSWGHHTDGIDSRQPPPDRNYFGSSGGSRWNTPPSHTTHRDPPPYHHGDRPVYPYPEPPQHNYNKDDRDFHAGKTNNNVYPTSPHQHHHQYHTPDGLDTPTPKTLDRPMSPIIPTENAGDFYTETVNNNNMHPTTSYHHHPHPPNNLDTPTPRTLDRSMPPINPTEDSRDECTFKNPYADYDMESCGVGRRCERDFHGVKRCVCISPFDCTGPTSFYNRASCQTSRDCLLSDLICVNSTCRNPCSPEHSPCAGIAYSECRVIERNVLCTCRRGFVGNPASGLDCRPKREVAIHHHTPQALAVSAMHGNYSDRNNFLNANFNETDTNDIIISAGSSGSTSRQHHRTDRAHDDTELKNVIDLGRCGFGSGQHCDEKSHCRVIDGSPMCVCKTGYKGEYPHCKPECEKNEDCSETMACQYHQCIDPCMEEKSYCAKNAVCRIKDHIASCECNPGYAGVPWVECSKKEETPVGTEDCMGFNCKKRSVR